MLNPETQLPKVINLLRSIAWRYCRRTGVDFDELMSEAYLCFMKCCKSYRKDKGTKFSSWCQFKVTMHMKTYLKRKIKDKQLIFVEEIVDKMIPVHNHHQTTLRNSLAEQIKELSPEAQALVRLLVTSPESEFHAPSKLLRGVCTTLAYENGVDPVFQQIIIHEIKAGISK